MNNRRKLTFYVGLFDRHTKVQKWSMIEAFKIVESVTASQFGGGTVSESTGIYQHNDGTVVVEPSIRIEVYSDEPYWVYVSTLKNFFNQESILVEESQIQYHFC